jgi:hypothetical protein
VIHAPKIEKVSVFWLAGFWLAIASFDLGLPFCFCVKECFLNIVFFAAQNFEQKANGSLVLKLLAANP